MGAGRFICVSIPFILTAVSIALTLFVGLSGITGNSIYLFNIEPRQVSISLANLKDLADNVKLPEGINLKTKRDLVPRVAFDLGDIDTGDIDPGAILNQIGGINITGADLNLADKYEFYLFNYVEKRGDTAVKTSPKFNYADDFRNTTVLADVIKSKGINVDVPGVVEDALNVFANLIKWTEVTFIIAAVSFALTLIVGIFGYFSRVGSCITWLVSGVSTVAIIAFAILASVTAISVVSTLKAIGENYGLKASVNNTWLTLVWIGAACAIASGFFWLFSVCCCKNEKRNKGPKHRDIESPVFGSKGYAPVHDDPFNAESSYGPQQQGIYHQQPYAIPMGNVKTSKPSAYEPYSHHGNAY
jgi:hypothetical protein